MNSTQDSEQPLYIKYGISVGQIYARADDPRQRPTLTVTDVLNYANCGDVVVVDISGCTYRIDCFKLAKVRYNLINKGNM